MSLTPEELAARQTALEDLGQCIADTKTWVQDVLQQVGWTQEHLLQKDEDLSVCPHDHAHLIPTSRLDKHITDCAILKQGYTREQLAKMKAPDHFCDGSSTVGTITIDDETFFEILQSVPGGYQPGTIRRQSRPLTVDRAAAELTQDERLALYNYCITKAKEASKPTSLPREGLMLLEDDKGEEKSGMTLMERRAIERDMKRRRQTYRGKSTHTTKRSHLEILKEVIDNQMDILTRVWQRSTAHREDGQSMDGARHRAANDRDDPKRQEDFTLQEDSRVLDDSRTQEDSRTYGETRSRDDFRNRDDSRSRPSGGRRSRSPPSRRPRTPRPSSRDRDTESYRDRYIKEEDTSSDRKSHKHKKHKKHKHKKDRKRSRSRDRSRERSRSRSRSNERMKETEGSEPKE